MYGAGAGVLAVLDAVGSGATQALWAVAIALAATLSSIVIGDLGRHDGIDLGPRVASVRRDEPGWEQRLGQVVSADLARPLTLRPRFVGSEPESVVATIEPGGETTTLSRVPAGKGRLWGRRDGEQEITSLSAPGSPSVAIPVPWRTTVAEP